MDLQGALGTTLERSRQLCMQLYEKPLFSPTATYIQYYEASGVCLTQQQQAAFAALVAWRDVMCRQLDEGIGRMMPKWLLVALSQQLPQTPVAVGKLVKPNLAAREYIKEVRIFCLYRLYPRRLTGVIKRAPACRCSLPWSCGQSSERVAMRLSCADCRGYNRQSEPPH